MSGLTNVSNKTLIISPILIKISNNFQQKKPIEKQPKKNYQNLSSSIKLKDIKNTIDLEGYENVSNNTLRNANTKTIANSLNIAFSDSTGNLENIFLIKQKYEKYLDWLDENYKSDSKLLFQKQKRSQNQNTQHKSLTSQISYTKDLNKNNDTNSVSPLNSSVDVSTLNWYQFEKSTSNKTQSKFKILTPKNETFSNLKNKSLYNMQKLPPTNVLPKIYTPTKSKVTRVSTKKVDRRKNDYTLIESPTLSNNTNYNSSLDDNLEPQSNTKAVQFDSNLFSDIKTTNNKQNNLQSLTFHIATTQQPLKPILKSTFSSDISGKSLNHSSITRLSGDNYSNLDLTAYNQNRNNSNNNMKLPLLMDSINKKDNCSDDFLAVVNDMSTITF